MIILRWITVVFIVAFLVGCGGTYEESAITVKTPLTTEKESVVVKVPTSVSPFQTKITKLGKELVVEGRVMEITFSRRGDIIVFEDGVTIGVCGAQHYIWKLGQVHVVKIKKRCGFEDRWIKEVEIK